MAKCFSVGVDDGDDDEDDDDDDEEDEDDDGAVDVVVVVDAVVFASLFSANIIACVNSTTPSLYCEL